MEKDNLLSLRDRWDRILRGKASDYEHKARKNGEVVCGPSLDDLANEMDAFFTGLLMK
jgi:hypothetical protein